MTSPSESDDEAPTGVFEAGGRSLGFVDVASFLKTRRSHAEPLPFCLRVVLENALRNRAELRLEHADLAQLSAWAPSTPAFSIPLLVSRVILPDSSGAPALIDLAALRSALARLGESPQGVEPRIPVDLVVDHSLIVEEAGHAGAQARNVALEFERNAERYQFLKWAQSAFSRLRVAPPGMGIVHQVHIERLARVIDTEERDGAPFAFPEFVLGGDSHTPMVGALGVLGWGVGGIEAEAAMLGQPYMVRVDRVIGVRLEGRLKPGATATDLVLTLTQKLREVGVVGQLVEFFGEGASALAVADRATLCNMAPEYGATTGFFPIDVQTIAYLRETGRDEAHVELVEAYARAAGLYRSADAATPCYSQIVDLDLGAIEPSVAGPRRPQDRLALSALRPQFESLLTRPVDEGGFGASPRRVTESGVPGHGAIAIAAITSCTNTSNPKLMLGAGLIAKRAVERGVRPHAWIKASLAPGSRVVTRYLERAGLLEPLAALGFHVVGYGCTTCSGKSGPLLPEMTRAIEEEGIVAAAVLSGNRNFEGRIHRLARANYIMSPMLVVAYAIAGRVDVDIATEPLTTDAHGEPVFLRDLWPSEGEIEDVASRSRDAALYVDNYARLFDGEELWRRLPASAGALFDWAPHSTYVVEPPFFERAEAPPDELVGARVLGLFGDSLTTDHISPAGEIPSDSCAGRYLAANGVAQHAFNAFTQRRGNHEVMLRGAFAHPLIRNLLAPDREGGFTWRAGEGDQPLYDAAMRYRAEGTPLIVIAGKDYGMGSSRDWAAKGTALLGIRAVIAESFERIHRSNLVALGVAPLTFRPGESRRGLGLTGRERYTITGIGAGCEQGAPVRARAEADDGRVTEFELSVAVDSAAERACLRAGGMFATIKTALLQQRQPVKEAL